MSFSEKPPSGTTQSEGRAGQLAERISSAREIARLEITEKAARSAAESQRTIHGLLSRVATQRATPENSAKRDEAGRELARRETALETAVHELEAARRATEGE
jgi:hypothetical protein